MATTINSGYGDSPKLTANIADHADVYGGRALVFDGVSDYLDCGDLTFLNSASAFSISVWIKSDNTNSLDYLYNKTSSSSNLIRMAIAYNIMYFNVYNGGNAYGSVAFTSTDWNHISLVFNGSGTGNSNRLKAYINGEEQSLTYTGTIPSSTGNLSGTAFQIGKYLTDHFEGSMCDFKIFNSALTEAQVQELYKKPENTPSAVQDNLVAWYPMIEGNPESPQSIVYDHSEKKLGGNIITNGDYSNGTTGWSIGAGGTADTSSGAVVYTYSGSGNNFVKQEGITAVNGALYKAVFTVTESGGSAYYGYWDGTNLSSSVINLDTGQKTYTQYFTATSTSITIRFVSGYTNGNSITVDNVSVKEVLMGNHAITNFFGDDLTNGHGAFDVTTNWSVVGGSLGTEWSIGSSKATHATGNTRSLRYENLSNPTIGGRKYQVAFTISGRTAGNLDFAVGSGPASASDFTASGSVILTSGGSASRIVDIITSSDFDGSVELITVKEVGISSSGFETAVNEPVVPQVPLMKYNQKMLFDNTDDYIDLPSPILTTIHSISFWVHTNDIASLLMPFSEEDSHEDGVHIYLFNNTISYRVNSVRKTENHTYQNKLTHFCCTYDGSTMNIYANGIVLGSGASNSTTLSVTTAGNIGTRSYAPNYFSDGIIDDFSIFNSALTQAQIQELFNDGVALDATTHSKADDHLLGYWRNDGVTTWTDRGDIQAIGFDGVDDGIRIPTSFQFALDDYATGAYSIWFYAYDQNPSSVQYILGARDGETATRVYIQIRSDGLRIAQGNVFSSYVSYSVNQWNHILVSWSSGTATFYFNGSQTEQFSFTTTSGSNIYNFILGGSYTAAGSFFNGNLGQFALWNTAQDSNISAIYALGRKGSLSDYSNGLQINYLLNPTHSNPDTTGTDKILDRSGNNIHGTQLGGVNFLGTNDGTVQGSPDSITIREGLNSNRDGLGFYFKNADSNTLRLNRKLEHLVIPYTKSLSATSMSDAITVECWVKFHNHPTGYNVIAGNASGGSWSNGWALAMVDNGLRFTINNYNSPKATFQITDFTKWYHIVGIYDRSLSSNNVALYVDLVRGTSAHYTTPIGESNQGIHIGYLHGEGAGVKASTCLIDELRIYNRVLTAFEADGSTPEDGETAISGEIVKNYKHGKGKHKND